MDILLFIQYTAFTLWLIDLSWSMRCQLQASLENMRVFRDRLNPLGEYNNTEYTTR